MGSVMARVDVESAYRFLPVHPHDWLLKEILYEGHLYIDYTTKGGAARRNFELNVKRVQVGASDSPQLNYLPANKRPILFNISI